MTRLTLTNTANNILQNSWYNPINTNNITILVL